MPYYQGLGIAALQLAEQTAEGGTLLPGTRIGRLSLLIQSTLIADSYGVVIVMPAVCAHIRFGTAALYVSVSAYHIMVTYHAPPLRTVPAVNVCGTALLCRPDGGAVDNQ